MKRYPRKRAWVRWFYVTRKDKSGELKEQTPKGTDTPAGFYHNEQGEKSTLEDRYIASGGKFKKYFRPNQGEE